MRSTPNGGAEEEFMKQNKPEMATLHSGLVELAAPCSTTVTWIVAAAMRVATPFL